MSVLGYHNIMKMSISAEVMTEIRVLIFVSHEGLPTVDFHHTNTPHLRGGSFDFPTDHYGVLNASKFHLSVNLQYDDLTEKFTVL